MEKVKFLFFCLVVTMIFSSCKFTRVCPSSWYCEPYTYCENGEILEICISVFGTSGGYKIGSSCYQCADINNIDYGGCDTAAQMAASDCLYSLKSDSNATLQEMTIDKSPDSELPNDEVIVEKIIQLKGTLENISNK